MPSSSEGMRALRSAVLNRNRTIFVTLSIVLLALLTSSKSTMVTQDIACTKPYDINCCKAHRNCPIKYTKSTANPYQTLSLEETFAYIREGGSLARFGDGEIRALVGGRIIFQESSTELIDALKFVASLGGNLDSAACLCIGTYPILDANFSRFREGKRREFAKHEHKAYMNTWKKFMPHGQYCDSFVSRPDGVDANVYSALNFFTPHWQSVFKDRSILLVRGSRQDNIPSVADTTVFHRHVALATRVEQLLTFTENGVTISLAHMSRNVFKHYIGIRDAILRRLHHGDIDVVVMSLGPTATVLAAELSCRGFHALDVGQFGGNSSKPDK